MAERKIVILGSTGSIGRNALDVVRASWESSPHGLRVVGLAAGSNARELAAQAREFCVRHVAIADERRADVLKAELAAGPVAQGPRIRGLRAPRFRGGCEEREAIRHRSEHADTISPPPSLSFRILTGTEGLCRLAALREADLVLNAVVGAAGLRPTYAALKAGKTVALANKECLVMGGELLTRLASGKPCCGGAMRGAALIPVDSEHSAIYQILSRVRRDEVSRVILTASGGPFYGLPKKALSKVTPEEALNHPRWKMGRKVSLDSATLMNKAFEVIEARWLFALKPEQIQVLVHPQSVVHALVELNDGTLLAHLSKPDMRLPIQFALSYPQRLDAVIEHLDLTKVGELGFYAPDLDRFPALELGYRAISAGGSMGAVLNAANDVACEAFLAGRLAFPGIAETAARVMDRHRNHEIEGLDDIFEADRWAREEARRCLGS